MSAMMPEDLPPELLAMVGGGEEAGMGPDGAPRAEAEEEDLSPDDHLTEAIKHLEQAAAGEPDNADSKLLSKTVSDLYGILSTREDAQMSAAGGNPKQLRAMGRSYGR